VDAAVQRLEESWRTRASVVLGDLSPAAGDPRRPRVLATLVQMDQEYRWESGERRPLEEYLAEWPELRQEPHLLVEMLAAECRTRAALGTLPTCEELHQRFPAFADLVNLDEIRQECDDDSPSDVAQSPGTCMNGPSEPLPNDDSSGDSKGTLPPGSRLDRYEIVRFLGSGAMGHVYLAKDAELGRFVAIKMVRPEWLQAIKNRDPLLDDARNAARLKHPAIVAMYDIRHQDDGTSYLVMEYVPGEPLSDLIKSGEMSREKAVETIIQIAEALHVAHKKGLVHRDIKPANILIDEEGQAHVIDFGLAVHEDEQRQRVGEFAGAPAYMAPEQIRGEAHRLDGRADIWALGVVLYEIFTGRRPFGGEHVEELSDEIQHRDPKPLRMIDDTIPAELERICLKCLAKDVTGRYSTARDLARDLRRWQRPRRWSFVLAVAAAVLVMILVKLWTDEPKPANDGRHTPEAGTHASREASHQEMPISEHPGQAVAPGLEPKEPTEPPLDGAVNAMVWNPEISNRRRVLLDKPDYLPLRAGDLVRIEAKLNRPAYVYVIWIDAEGVASPAYPWTEGRWDQRPADESKKDQLSLPETQTKGWPVREPPGMETLMLLARNDPLPQDVDMSALFADLPPQRLVLEPV